MQSSVDWLTAEEKQRVEHILRAETRRAEKSELWPALLDARVIVLGIVMLGNQCTLYGVQLWLPQIVQGMGYSNFATGFVVSLCFIAAMVTMILWGRRSDAKGERIWHVALPLMLAAIGLGLTAAAPSPLLMLMAITFSLIGTLAYNGQFLSLPATFLS